MTGVRVPTAATLLPPPGTPTGLTAHLDRHGPLPVPHRDGLIATVRSCGLVGHGGAGFPTWRKLAAVAGASPVVIANGAEGEPASRKDRELLIRSPHLVLDGLQLAASAVGAEEALIATHPDAGATTAQALAGRPGDRAVGHLRVPARFLSGEESALVNAVAGRPGLPRDTPPRVYETGVRGRPTLVLNVETLAQLALVARNGPGWYRGRGTPEEPGMFLATVSGAVAAPGVFEVDYGTPLAELLGRAGGSTEPLQAVLLGGYHGIWQPATDLPLSRGGAGVVVALGASTCGLVEAAGIVRYLAEQSAGQCGPCLSGLPRMAGVLTQLADRRRAPELVPAMHRLAALVEGRGACHHPDGTARMIRSALRTFATDVALHLRGGCVTAGI